MINWNRLFPPLRQRRNINYQEGPRSEQRAPPPLEVSEEQVTMTPVLSPVHTAGLKQFGPARNKSLIWGL